MPKEKCYDKTLKDNIHFSSHETNEYYLDATHGNSKGNMEVIILDRNVKEKSTI